MNKSEKIIQKALNLEQLSADELLYLYITEDPAKLALLAHNIRLIIHPNNNVGWMIDRNINITNICTSGCIFCSFHCSKNSSRAYITDILDYELKIKELFEAGGNQILLQGGMHPNLGIEYYEQLFKDLKQLFPNLKLHALGPPEIFYLSKKAKITIKETLTRLVKSGLDSLPGAGAEILDNDVRRKLSPNKCSADEWFQVMIEAHKINLPTSATMMFGHIETIDQRIDHLIKIRDVQNMKPEGNYGFLSFIPWSVQSKNTNLSKKYQQLKPITNTEYLKLISISRIALTNILNIQSSLLTIGIPTAQLSLYCGANDLGSIMIEENVVSSSNSGYRVNAQQMISTIKEAGFCPTLRDQKFQKTHQSHQYNIDK